MGETPRRLDTQCPFGGSPGFVVFNHPAGGTQLGQVSHSPDGIIQRTDLIHQSQFQGPRGGEDTAIRQVTLVGRGILDRVFWPGVHRFEVEFFEQTFFQPLAATVFHHLDEAVVGSIDQVLPDMTLLG